MWRCIVYAQLEAFESVQFTQTPLILAWGGEGSWRTNSPLPDYEVYKALDWKPLRCVGYRERTFRSRDQQSQYVNKYEIILKRKTAEISVLVYSRGKMLWLAGFKVSRFLECNTDINRVIVSLK